MPHVILRHRLGHESRSTTSLYEHVRLVPGEVTGYEVRMEPTSLRLADPSEIDLLVAIDDDATRLYTDAGVHLALAADGPFTTDERRRWLRAAELQRAFLAVDGDGRALGFAALDLLDGEPYLDQLAVRYDAMRRGVGRALLERTFEWAATQAGAHLWLTTYRHLPWNAPYYERHGFQIVPEAECGAGIVHHLDEQRRWLPHPEQRIAMRRPVRC